jgi:hypothetical protein
VVDGGSFVETEGLGDLAERDVVQQHREDWELARLDSVACAVEQGVGGVGERSCAGRGESDGVEQGLYRAGLVDQCVGLIRATSVRLGSACAV